MSHVSALRSKNMASQPVERRVATFAAVLAMHVGLIILLVAYRPAVMETKQGSLSVFSLAAAASTPPVVLAVPIVPAETAPPISTPAETFAKQQGAEGDPDGEVCSPVDAVTMGLANDPIVPAAIDNVPRADRSISEAIVMWNAEWSSSAADDDAPMAEVKNLILLTLADLPPECLAMPVVGPRLIPISAESGSTTFLAFGSGEWSWQQLTEAPETLPTDKYSWTWEDLANGDVPPIF